jgi:hypothetical protein
MGSVPPRVFAVAAAQAGACRGSERRNRRFLRELRAFAGTRSEPRRQARAIDVPAPPLRHDPPARRFGGMGVSPSRG